MALSKWTSTTNNAKVVLVIIVSCLRLHMVFKCVFLFWIPTWKNDPSMCFSLCHDLEISCRSYGQGPDSWFLSCACCLCVCMCLFVFYRPRKTTETKPKRNRNETETKPKRNRNETETKPKRNRNETKPKRNRNETLWCPAVAIALCKSPVLKKRHLIQRSKERRKQRLSRGLGRS